MEGKRVMGIEGIDKGMILVMNLESKSGRRGMRNEGGKEE